MADVVQRADMRMIQAGYGLGFLIEALPQSWVGGKMRGKNLDGNGAVQAGVERAINFAHAARAERSDHLIGTEPGSVGEGHGELTILPQAGRKYATGNPGDAER